MLAIFEKIRRPASNAADLRARHAEVETTLIQLEDEVLKHQQKRSAALLSLPDREIEKIETELAVATRNRDRARAALTELERRANETEEAEARASLDAERAAVEKRAQAIASRLRSSYEEHGAAIVALLTELSAAEEAVRIVNHKLTEAKRGEDALRAVESRVVDHGRNSEVVASLRALTSLRPLGACAGWGAAATAAVLSGLPR